MLNNAKDICNNLGVDSITDALAKLTTPLTPANSSEVKLDAKETEVKNETTENQQENFETNLPQDGK